MAFRSRIRERLLIEMLRSTRSANASAADWKVLIMDEFTIKIMSSSCKVADITDEGISLVEDLSTRRQPMPSLDAVYFIQPSKKSVKGFMEDMNGVAKAAAYRSSPLPTDLLHVIKQDSKLRSRIASLKEMNLEIATVDKQGFVTEQDNALVSLFCPQSRDYEKTIALMGARLATVFASLNELPAVRYRAAKTSSTSQGTPERARDLIPTKLAAALWDRLMNYKHSLPEFPQKDTCELLIVDRSLDVITPMIHDWSYAGMVYDILHVDGNKYVYEVENKHGEMEQKTVLLDEHDPIWVEVRDLFYVDAVQVITTHLKEYMATMNTNGEMTAREMQQRVANLGKAADFKDKVDLHVGIASSMSKILKTKKLAAVGELEQGFVFADSSASYKEMASMFGQAEEMETEDKVRLLGIYAATNKEKFDDKKVIWKKMAKLTTNEILSVVNLEFMGVVGKPPKEEGKKGFWNVGGSSSSKGLRVAKEDDSGNHMMRYYPLLQDTVEEMAEGKLSTSAFPYVQEPAGAGAGRAQNSVRGGATVASRQPPQSMRGGGGSGGSTGPNWAKSARTTGPQAAAAAAATPSAKEETPRGRRIFVFMVGGMIRSEVRSAHVLTKKLNREVVMGSTSLDIPSTFLDNLRSLAEMD